MKTEIKLASLPEFRPSLLGRSVFDDILNSMLDFPVLMDQTTRGYPVADIYSEDDKTVMEFALAGFSKEELTIEIKPEKNSITVSAATAADPTIENASDQLKEKYRVFHRRVARRDFSKTYVDYDNKLDLSATTAEFENGLLRLTVPVKQEAKPLTIEIN